MTSLGVDGTVVALIGLVVVVGATVQVLVGLGLNLVSAPLVTLLDPSLMPELPLALAVLLPVVTLVESHDEIDWRGLAWILPGRVPGTAAGVWLLAVFSDRALGLVVGVMVLVSVAFSLRAVEVPTTRPVLLAGGVVSGVTGTTTSIGGPAMALMYQHRPPAQIRSTLAVFFMIGALISLAGIGVAGRLEVRALLLALILTPGLVVGTWIGVRLRRLLPEGSTRYAVLAVVAAAGLLLFLRSLFA